MLMRDNVKFLLFKKSIIEKKKKTYVIYRNYNNKNINNIHIVKQVSTFG